MKVVKIRFSDRESETKGIGRLMRKGRVICLPKNTYVIPQQGLKVLDEIPVAYELLAEEGLGYAYHLSRAAALKTPDEGNIKRRIRESETIGELPPGKIKRKIRE